MINSKHFWINFAFRRSHNTLRIHENRTWLIIIPFKIYLKSFPIQKLFHFFSFLSLSLNVEKVYQRLLWCPSPGKQTTPLQICSAPFLNSPESHGPNHADDNPRKQVHVWHCINKNFARNLLLVNRCSIFFQWQFFTKKARRLMLVNISVPAQRRTF